MNFNKIRKFCRVFRIILGLALIVTGIVQLGSMENASLFFLGVIPLAAGIFDFCPLCMFTNKCELPQNK